MPHRIGNQTVGLDHNPVIAASAAVGGKKEHEGPLAPYFDILCNDTTFGESSWEKSESRLQQLALEKALEKGELASTDVEYLFAGDLLNQCIGSAFAAKDNNIPFIGLYGACSTMAESLGLAACFVEGGLTSCCAALTSSHFCSSERQFRFPLEYGSQRTPTAQWTATAAGAAIVKSQGDGPAVKAVTFGKIKDLGITDMNNMGAAMAPAAADTIAAYFTDTNAKLTDYDVILTGDLGQVGSKLLYQLLDEENIDIRKQHKDCGLLLYDQEKQGVNAGGSGCGCAASVLCGYVLEGMRKNQWNNILFIATGALLSTVSVQQGSAIPSIAHLIHISNVKA